jgi:hypothetical protein
MLIKVATVATASVPAITFWMRFSVWFVFICRKLEHREKRSTIILLFTNGKARFTYAKEHENKLKRGENVSGKLA